MHSTGLPSPSFNRGSVRADRSPLNGVVLHGQRGFPIAKGNRKDYRGQENNNFLFDLVGARDNLRGIPRGISDNVSDLLGGRNLRKVGPNSRPSVTDVFPDLVTARDDLRATEPYERPTRVVNPGRNGLYGTDLRPVSKVLKKRVYGSFRQGNYWVTDYGC